MKTRINIQDFIELNSEAFDSLTEKMVYEVSILSEIDPHIIYEYEPSLLYNEYESVKDILKNIDSNKYKDVIKYNDYEFKLREFNTLTFGQYIDLEYYITNDKDYNNNIAEMVAILYNQYSKQELNNVKYEEYSDINIEERSNIFRVNIDIMDVIGAVNKYIKFRNSLFDAYNFFVNTEDEEEDLDKMSDEERRIYKQEKKKEEKEKKNIWVNILDVLADGDITKYNDILNLGIIFVFNKFEKHCADNSKINTNQ